LNTNDDIFLFINQLPMMKFVNMREEDIDWIFVKNEILLRGCGVGIAFGKLAFEINNEDEKILEENLFHPSLMTRKYRDSIKRKSIFEYTTIQENSNYDEFCINSSVDPYIHRIEKFKGSEIEFRNFLKRKNPNEINRIENKPENEFAESTQDFYSLGFRCQLHITQYLTGKIKLKNSEEYKEYLVHYTKEAHKNFNEFMTSIFSDQSLVNSLEKFRSIHNEIFKGLVKIVVNIDQIYHRRFSIEKHLIFCMVNAKGCCNGFLISDHKLRKNTCSDNCRKKENLT
jgi:hypothetical protein